jgi:hypothetical protein
VHEAKTPSISFSLYQSSSTLSGAASQKSAKLEHEVGHPL